MAKQSSAKDIRLNLDLLQVVAGKARLKKPPLTDKRHVDARGNRDVRLRPTARSGQEEKGSNHSMLLTPRLMSERMRETTFLLPLTHQDFVDRAKTDE